jgi:hypothetical protein
MEFNAPLPLALGPHVIGTGEVFFYLWTFLDVHHHAMHRAAIGMEITTAARRAEPGVEQRLRRGWPMWGRAPTCGSGRL